MTNARLFQIAYVTRDLDRGAAVLAAQLGLPDVSCIEMTVTTDDGEQSLLNVGFAWRGDLQLEIIEPRGGSDAIFRDALPAHGSVVALHHLGYLVPSLEEMPQLRAEAIGRGLLVPFSGHRGEESAFFYADARRSLGHYLEYLYLSPQRLAFHRSQSPGP